MDAVLKQVLFGHRFSGARRILPTTNSGWETYQNGSRLFLPAATNLATDPQGTAQTFWPADSANTDLTPNQALPVALDASMSTVTKCIKLVNDGTADNVQTANITVVASTSYRSRLYIYAPTVGGNITITAETGSSLAIGTITTANAGFMSFGAATNTAGGQTTLAYKIAFAGGTASTIYITAVSLVASTIEQPHFDGTYPNCAWTGVAHASTSTRTVSNLTYGPGGWASTQGTVAIRFVPLWASATAALDIFLVSLNGGTTGTRAFDLCERTYNALSAGINNNIVRTDSGVSVAALSTAVMVGRWTGASTVDLNVNGTDAAQVVSATTQRTATQLEIGNLVSTALNAKAYIGPVLVSSTRKSDAWVTAIQASSGAAYASLPRLWRQFMSAGDLLIPLYGDSMAYLKRSGRGSQA